MQWHKVACVAFWLLVLLGPVAHSQVLCVDRAEMLDYLATGWGEELVEVEDFGLYGLLEVLRSPTEGTWTLLLTRPGKISCMLATGRGLGVDEDSLEKTEYML